MRRRGAPPAIASLVATVLAGCATPALPARSPAVAQSIAIPAAIEEPLVELRAPARAPWVSSLLAPARPTIRIRLTNRAAVPLDVRDLRARLDVEREGSGFGCQVEGEPGLREPVVLAPHTSHVFARTIDCGLPLTGTYAVTVAVSFGRGAWASPRIVETFRLAVEAPDHLEPKPFGDSGLWAAVGASSLIAGEGGHGSGRIAFLLVNGSAAPISPPALRLALRVYRKGSPIPCEDAPIAVRTALLLPGAALRQPIEVSCLGLHAPGDYEIVARLLDATSEVEVGRLHLAISNDPAWRATPPR
jgi:hypothetical protein